MIKWKNIQNISQQFKQRCIYLWSQNGLPVQQVFWPRNVAECEEKRSAASVFLVPCWFWWKTPKTLHKWSVDANRLTDDHHYEQINIFSLILMALPPFYLVNHLISFNAKRRVTLCTSLNASVHRVKWHLQMPFLTSDKSLCSHL